MEKHYLICCYVPETHLERVKMALFEAGAGKIGEYEHCCWQTSGQGQFRPLEHANPSVGELLKITHIKEFKIELVCEKNIIEKCIDALKTAHPYEEPAYQIIEFKA